MYNYWSRGESETENLATLWACFYLCFFFNAGWENDGHFWTNLSFWYLELEKYSYQNKIHLKIHIQSIYLIHFRYNDELTNNSKLDPLSKELLSRNSTSCDSTTLNDVVRKCSSNADVFRMEGTHQLKDSMFLDDLLKGGTVDGVLDWRSV